MNALRLHLDGSLRVHEEPDPVPGPDELLVRVSAVGLCGSDRHWLLERSIGDALLERPLVLGHEFAGAVEDGPRAGERVVIDPAVPCEVCAVCRTGDGHLCPNIRFAGHGTTDGGLRTLVAWPERLVYTVPPAVGVGEAALLEPLGVALHAFDLGHVRPGARVAVVGCGPIGLLLVQLLRLEGADPIVAIDRLPHRAAAATGFGASDGVSPADSFDVVFEVTDSAAAVDTAMTLVRPGGRLVLVGIPAGDRTSFRASTARRKGLSILLSRRMTAADLPRAIELAGAGRVALSPLISGRYALDEWPEAFASLREYRGLKTVIEPQRMEEDDR